ncbi:MAG: ADP-ribosylglycohydrolase family protein, partial [Luminiphilus sp.]|nr:ADP-ribosylglycohydrolase family protein [Luminiphilus sp.]
PAATWGGLLGFMLGRNEIERLFGEPLSDNFDIHRTRKGFADDGIDTFRNMAKMAISVSATINNETMTSPE